MMAKPTTAKKDRRFVPVYGVPNSVIAWIEYPTLSADVHMPATESAAFLTSRLIADCDAEIEEEIATIIERAKGRPKFTEVHVSSLLTDLDIKLGQSLGVETTSIDGVEIMRRPVSYLIARHYAMITRYFRDKLIPFWLEADAFNAAGARLIWAALPIAAQRNATMHFPPSGELLSAAIESFRLHDPKQAHIKDAFDYTQDLKILISYTDENGRFHPDNKYYGVKLPNLLALVIDDEIVYACDYDRVIATLQDTLILYLYDLGLDGSAYETLAGLNEEFVKGKKQFGSDIEGRLIALDAFIRNNPGMPVADRVREILAVHIAALGSPLPSLAVDTGAFPEVAPLLYMKDRMEGEAPPDFIKRVYQPWLGKGFTRATLRNLDPSLSRSLDHWLKKNEMPDDLDLPKLSELNSRQLEEIKGKDTGTFSAKEARRMASVAWRREHPVQK